MPTGTFRWVADRPPGPCIMRRMVGRLPRDLRLAGVAGRPARPRPAAARGRRGPGPASVAGVALLVLALRAARAFRPFDAQPQEATRAAGAGRARQRAGHVGAAPRVDGRSRGDSDRDRGQLCDPGRRGQSPPRDRGPGRRADRDRLPDNVTGHLAEAVVNVDVETLPIEATVAGTPPHRRRPIGSSTSTRRRRPERASLWPLSIIPALLGSLLLIGARVGYPIFRETFEIDVLSAPLGPGSACRPPTAAGSAPTGRELGDPGAALLLVRRGPKGNVPDRPAPGRRRRARRRTRGHRRRMDERTNRLRLHGHRVGPSPDDQGGGGRRDLPLRHPAGARSRCGTGRRRDMIGAA